MKKIKWYELSVIAFFIVCPFISIGIEMQLSNSAFRILLLKWFAFYSIGLRLLSAGIKQVLSPGFTAKEIFEINDPKSHPIILELGFSNICLGLLGVCSIAIHEFRLAAAFAGGIYFGLAGSMHLFRKNKNNIELFAMVSDLYIFIVLLIIIITNL
ncbi:MAG: hypothetical protein QM644_07490 [Mobilitalea sp.]